jgi:hypothetical protein
VDVGEVELAVPVLLLVLLEEEAPLSAVAWNSAKVLLAGALAAKTIPAWQWL